MAKCPFAVQQILHPEDAQAPKITPLQLILHTAVSKAQSLYGYFSRLDVTVESHFYIAQDGTLYQYVDTEQRADAQFDGNLHGVSVETWDDGDPNNVELTAAQVDTFCRLARWLHDTHGIPLEICAGPQEGGLGYHSLFGVWAKDGHTCPNALRIAQFRNVIIPRLRAGASTKKVEKLLHIIKGDDPKDTRWWKTDYVSKSYISNPDHAKIIVWDSAVAGVPVEHDGQGGPVTKPASFVNDIPTVKAS